MNHAPTRQDGEGVRVVVRGPIMENAMGVLELVVSEAAILGLSVAKVELRYLCIV